MNITLRTENFELLPEDRRRLGARLMKSMARYPTIRRVVIKITKKRERHKALFNTSIRVDLDNSRHMQIKNGNSILSSFSATLNRIVHRLNQYYSFRMSLD